jgi:hypothetical protein
MKFNFKLNFKYRVVIAFLIFIILLAGCWYLQNRQLEGKMELFETEPVLGSFATPFTFGQGPLTLTDGGDYYIIVDDAEPEPRREEFPNGSKFIQVPRELNGSNYIILGTEANPIDGISITGYSGHIGPEDGKRIIVPDNWAGLFQNGKVFPPDKSGDSNYIGDKAFADNFTIRNIHIRCEKDELLGSLGEELDDSVNTSQIGTGGICKSFFGKGLTNTNTNIIDNCSFEGNISENGGGICGGYCGIGFDGDLDIRNDIDGAKIIIQNCYSNGDIDIGGGGICGVRSGCTGANITIQNCYSIGIKKGHYTNRGSVEGAGGICGRSGAKDGTVTIINCYSDGNIGNGSGGICGDSFGHGDKGNVIIHNCYSKGIIESRGGGICGANCGALNSMVEIHNCYSIGTINDDAGGICGYICGFGGKVEIQNCYSEGAIEGESAGGICGRYCGLNNGQVTIQNCYSIGNISGNSGGICGSNCGQRATVNITNCYSIGDISDNDAGGICGANCGYEGEVTIQNCLFKATGTFGEDTDADAVDETPREVINANAINNKLIGSGSITDDSNKNYKYVTDFAAQANNSIAIDVTNVWNQSSPPWKLCWQKLGFGDDFSSCSSNTSVVTITNPGKYVLTTKVNYGDANAEYGIPIIVTPNDNGEPALTKDNYIIMASDNIEITTDDTITHDKPIIVEDGWRGLFVNGENIQSIDGTTYGPGNSNNYQIRNIHIKCTDAILGQCGGILFYHFGRDMKSNNNLIENCSFEGNIATRGGGISGSYCGHNGVITIRNCYSNLKNPDGKIGISGGAKEGSGGICGENCGYEGGDVTIQNCNSSGILGNNGSGGICAEKCGNNGKVTIQNCYSTASFSNNGVGGICGSECGKGGGTVLIQNCYYIGTIKGSSAGGICGSSCSNAQIQNCYSSGIIKRDDGALGGICGSNCGYEEGNVDIINCLYNSSGCENDTINLTSAVLGDIQLNQVVGSINSSGTINIINTGYFSNFKIGNLNNFDNMAKQTILKNPDKEGNLDDVWEKCPNGLWLLQWQVDSDAESPKRTCAVTFPDIDDEGDDLCPTPMVTTPMVTTPMVTTPMVTTPMVTTPMVTTPMVTTPMVTTPQVTTPQVTTPQVEVTEVTKPSSIFIKSINDCREKCIKYNNNIKNLNLLCDCVSCCNNLNENDIYIEECPLSEITDLVNCIN